MRVVLSNVAERLGHFECTTAFVRASERRSKARYTMTIPETARLTQIQVNALRCTSKLIRE